MINRTLAPPIKNAEEIDFIEPWKEMINDSIPLYLMREVQNETSRFDLYFDAGKNSGERGLSSFVNGLILSGTKSSTSIEINESISALGGFYQSGVSMENAVISVYSLREYLPELLSILTDAISHVHFDDREIKEYISDRRQKHRESLGKVSYLAQRLFQQKLFISQPRYASVIHEEDFDEIDRNDFIAFHKEHYLDGLQKVVIVGNLNDDQIELVKHTLKPLTSNHRTEKAKSIIHETGRFHQEKKGAMQTAIRMGRILFNKNHPDYLDFLVLNTILGDYFGSRLMSNIREDKGYTYGIGSMINEFDNTGYFMIGTEVKKEVAGDTLNEIRKEIERLQNEPVGNDELELVKNYMLGQLLKSADGPYAMMDLFLSAEAQGKDLEFYNEAIHSISAITPGRIMELAQRYLRWEDMTVVSAG